MTKHDPIPARLAALRTTSTPDLKKQWRELFDSERPPFNRRYLESRLAYRIQGWCQTIRTSLCLDSDTVLMPRKDHATQQERRHG